MYWIVGLTSLALVAGVVATWRFARGQRWSWGWTVRPGPLLGESLYRAAPVTLQKPRRLPVICAAASITAVAWGALTTLIFAPAGLVGSLVSITAIDDLGWPFALGSMGIFAAAFSGSFLGLRLMSLVKVLAVRTTGSADRLGQVARASLVHHGLVAVSLALWALTDDLFVFVYLIVVSPAAVGVAQAGLLYAAAAALVRLDRDDQDQRRAA